MAASTIPELALNAYLPGTRLQRKIRNITNEEDDLSMFKLNTIASATNQFGDGNKIGKGGFGDVYKV